MACLVLHNLLRIRYPVGQQADTGGEGQPAIVLQSNDIQYDGCNPMEAAKRQRNILRDYFMNEGQLPVYTAGLFKFTKVLWTLSLTKLVQ